MTREAIVAIRPDAAGGLFAYLDSASVNYDDAEVLFPLQLDAMALPRLDTSVNVEAYGRTLRQALSRHPAIQQELIQIFGTVQPDRATLQFLIRTPHGERVRWETLCDEPARFLAMTDVCTISRVTSARVAPGFRALTYPLRMAAFLSAAGISAAAEFREICRQVTTARANGLKLECTVYLGEQDLLDDAQKQIGKEEFSGIHVAPIPPNSVDIGELLKGAPIQFLHFFCHGIESAGVQALSLATISDHDKNGGNNKAAGGSITLSVDRLSEALALNRTVWIAVFNSCSGANVLQQLHSMALTVAKKGCPYTVGMAEPIESTDATRFSEAFYGELFSIVRKNLTVDVGSAPVMLDLAPAVVPARKKFHELYLHHPPDAFGRWSLPVLYQKNSQPLMVQAIDPVMAKRIQEVARTLQILPADTPIELRDKILE